MIFPPDQAKQIKAGAKTEYRRPIGCGEHVCRVQVGKDYAVQPARQRGDHNRPPRSICRILITGVTRDLQGTIDDDHAEAEGFRDIGHYLDAWEALHGTIDLETPVWVVTFHLHRRGGTIRDTPLYLHKGVIGGNYDDAGELAERGYTTNPDRALIDAGEVIDAGRTSEAFASLQRWSRDRKAAARAMSEMPVALRIEHALLSAKAAGIDTADYERALHRRAAAIENRARHRAA